MEKQTVLSSGNLPLINKSWTLFLDRDGVINYDKVGGYNLNPDDFIFYNGLPEAFLKLSKKFGRIIVVTNQRGVGRGAMTHEDLEAIHKKMMAGIEAAGGRIDAIFSATSLTENDPLRKPNPGMALLAKQQFPEIDFSRSIMVGNNISDMQFGRNNGMFTVFLKTTQPDILLPHPTIDMAFSLLTDFVTAL